MATKKTTSSKKINFGKAAPAKKMLGSAKSPHKAAGFKTTKPGGAAKKKLKENAALTFKEKRHALLVTMLESMIDGDDSQASVMLKEYLSLKSHQIIMEKDDDEEVDADEDSKLDSAKSKLDDVDDDGDSDEDDVDDEDSDEDDGDSDEDDVDDEDSDEDDGDTDEDEAKIFKTKKEV